MFYPVCLKKYWKKLDKHLWPGLFCGSCTITYHNLLKMNQTLGVVPKTNDEIYVSVSIGKYIITFHLFSVLYQRRYCCSKYRNWGSHLKNRYHYAKVVENARINFSISPYCTLLFSRKENFKFLEVALSAVLCNGAVGCIMNVWGYQHWIPHWTFTCFLKTAIKALKQGVKFVET